MKRIEKHTLSQINGGSLASDVGSWLSEKIGDAYCAVHQAMKDFYNYAGSVYQID